MLENQFHAELKNAAQPRVSTSELTQALASLEARHARRAYEDAGTITLAEGIREFGLDVTPEELLAEVDRLRDIEAAQQKAAQRHKRLRLILKAELISATLCLLTMIGLQHTIFNRQWQQAQQAADFQHKLQLSTGPHPKYEIFVVPNTGSGIPAGQTFGIWRDAPTYPLYSVPDGYSIYHFDGLDDDGHTNLFGNNPYILATTTYIEFREDQQPWFRDNVSVYYNGQQYWRGWIRKQDIARLKAGHSFTLYPALVAASQYKMTDIVPLTVSMNSIRTAYGQMESDRATDYQFLTFPEGNHLQLDQHAWEPYSAFPER